MSKAIKQFNGLNGEVVTKKEIKKIYVIAGNEGQTHLAQRLAQALEKAKNEDCNFKIDTPAIEQVSSFDLPGLSEMPGYIDEEEFTGLNKAVSPDDIYKYITNLIIETINKVGYLPWQREWKQTALFNGLQAVNFESKKGYRGINFFLLNFEVKKDKNGIPYLVAKSWKNPYFLTFNQIEKQKGKLKKGSNGHRVVYFTKMFSYSEKLENGKTLSFSTYNQGVFKAWIIKNQTQLQILKRSGWNIDRLANSYIPILKYYNVFNAEDIEGIDWKELPKNANVVLPVKERIQIAEDIVKLMPKAPKIHFKGDQPAYYPSADEILMTPIEAFTTEEFYYSTLFHELVHSTKHPSRLNDKSRVSFINGRKDKKKYAFEELIAEMGAIFLCAESGILFSTINNSAKYLKGWNKSLVKNMKEDNRFFFRAASKSQAAADYMLDRNNEGVPAYQRQKTKKTTPSNTPKKANKLKVSEKNIVKPKKIEILKTSSKGAMLITDKKTTAWIMPRQKRADGTFTKGAIDALKNGAKYLTKDEYKTDLNLKKYIKIFKPFSLTKTGKAYYSRFSIYETISNQSISRIMFVPKSLVYIKDPRFIIIPKWFLDKKKEELFESAETNSFSATTFLLEIDTAPISYKELETINSLGLKGLNAPNDYLKNLKQLTTKFNENILNKKKGLNAPWHTGIAIEALTDCGRLLPGYKYKKGGEIVKVETKNKKRSSTKKPCIAPNCKKAKAVKKVATKKVVAKKSGQKNVSLVISFPINEINLDTKRFQNRNKLNSNVVDNIVNDFKETQLDPLIVWTDPKNKKVYLLAGHHRLAALKKLWYENAPVKFADDDYPSEKEAIKYARQLSNANRTLETPAERANIYREMLHAGKSLKEVKVAAKIEGKNQNYILNLAALNANGIVIETIERLVNTPDKQNEKAIEKIADWIGEARKKYDALTNAHETEMFNFLSDSSASKRIKTKADFLQKIYALAGGFDFDHNEPLNLKRIKYETEGEKAYNNELAEMKTKIENKLDSITDLKARFSDPGKADYIKPTAAHYQESKTLADEKISQLNTEIKRLQKRMLDHSKNKSKFLKVGSEQGALFGEFPTQHTPKTNEAEAKHSGEVAPPRSSVVKKSKVLTASDIMSQQFETLNFNKDWGQLFQDPAKNMKIAIWGKPKNGKTASACQFANYLTEFGSILYNFADQGFNQSTKNLLKLSGLDNNPKAYFTASNTIEELEESIKEVKPQFVFIDMINDYINKSGLKYHEFKENIIKKYPNIGFILIFEVTKEGNFKGDQGWTHLVDGLVTIEDYMASSKGRYGMGERIMWHEGAKKFNPSKYAEILGETPTNPTTQEPRTKKTYKIKIQF